MHLSSPPKFWQALTRAIGRPELERDLRFRDRAARREHYDELRVILADVFATEARAEWLRRLREQDVPCAPLNTLAEVFADPEVQRLGLEIELTHPTMGDVRLTGNPVGLERTPVSYRLAPPTLGEHTEEVLTGLGYDSETQARWHKDGVI